MKDDERYMRMALEEARRAAELGEVPVGCVIVGPRAADDEPPAILARAHNLTRTDVSPLAHAELLAIDAATKQLGYERLNGCTVYVTLEPCFMCAGALVHARVERVVWAARDPKFGGCASLGEVLTDPRLNHRAHIREGVLADEASALLVDFFRSRRKP